MDRLTYRDDTGRAVLTRYGMRMYCSTQATADCFAKLEESIPKWISVKERLPETDGNYLVWMRWPDDEEPVVSIINFDSTAQEFGEWEDYYDHCTLGWVGSDFMKIENVYAWMPLPEPPKEGGGEDG